MKVFGINNIVFKSDTGGINNRSADYSVPVKTQREIKELNYVTPDFGVCTPVSYKKTAVDKLDNGLEVYSYKMSNGYKVTIVPMKNSPAVVKSYVNVGSMNETKNIKGISHFLEHMAFNGTNGENGHLELKQGDSFKKIDKLGGWANASTNYAITDYVNSTPLLGNKDLETQIRVIASMAEDLKLSEDMIKKEKGPVSSEINMIMDNPQTIALDQTIRTLFNVKNPADELVGGSVAHIQNLTREDVVDYYNKYYTPDNTNIVITGDVNPDEVMAIVSKNFISKKISKGQKFEEKLVPIEKTVRKDFISDKATSSEIVIGFAGVKNNDTKGKVLYDLALTYLESHEAGLTDKLKKQNVYPVISSEKISTDSNARKFNFIALRAGDERVESILQDIFSTLGRTKKINNETLERLKQRLKQNNEDLLEHSIAVNDCVGYSVLDNDLKYVTEYNKILDSVTPDELTAAIKENFDINKAAITVVHPDKNKNISFKGSSRLPIDTNDISEYKLNNNYNVGFYDTNSNNINLSLNLYKDKPHMKNPGVIEVLNQIYANGIKGYSYNDFENFKDKNNMSLSVKCGHNGIVASFAGDTNNYQLGTKTLENLLLNPNITEETLATAVSKVKDNLNRLEKNSAYMQSEFDNMITPFASMNQEVLDNIDKITVDDVKEFHNYLINNSRGIVTANVPKSDSGIVKNNILQIINNLPAVEPNNYKQLDIYHDITVPAVFTVPNYNSQADISETFRFKYNGTTKEKAVGAVMNSILSNSSIGLFDVLREKENLAYSVYSNISSMGNRGKLSLNILTTTDNKDIGEQKFDNVQKSINGFNRQIKELISGNFTDEDIEIAKRSIKASLLNNEGNYAKICAIESGLNSAYGINMKNQVYKEVDNITKKDITEFAQNVFAGAPIYSIAASQDTLDANKEFLENLKH